MDLNEEIFQLIRIQIVQKVIRDQQVEDTHYFDNHNINEQIQKLTQTWALNDYHIREMYI